MYSSVAIESKYKIQTRACKESRIESRMILILETVRTLYCRKIYILTYYSRINQNFDQRNITCLQQQGVSKQRNAVMRNEERRNGKNFFITGGDSTPFIVHGFFL